MSISAVSFKSTMAASPLKSNNNVSFARKTDASAQEPKKSHKTRNVLIGLGTAAVAIASAFVFKGKIGELASKIKMPSMQNVGAAFNNAKQAVTTAAEKAGTFVKEAGTKIVDGSKNVASKTAEGVSKAAASAKNAVSNLNVGSKLNSAKTATTGFFKSVWGYISKAAVAVKDFVVKIFNGILGYFKKPAV